jgi:hypothetical protein
MRLIQVLAHEHGAQRTSRVERDMLRRQPQRVQLPGGATGSGSALLTGDPVSTTVLTVGSLRA